MRGVGRGVFGVKIAPVFVPVAAKRGAVFNPAHQKIPRCSQARWHVLDWLNGILQLLGVQQGAIALTKIDAVADERVAQVRAQLQGWLARSTAGPWPGQD